MDTFEAIKLVNWHTLLLTTKWTLDAPFIQNVAREWDLISIRSANDFSTMEKTEKIIEEIRSKHPGKEEEIIRDLCEAMKQTYMFLE